MIKKVLTIAMSALLVFVGCEPKDPEPTPVNPGKEQADPELTINGVPGSALESGSSFVLKLASKSSGAISLSIDKPSMAFARAKSDTEYEITASSVEDATVGISISQEETEDYLAAQATCSFKVKGSGVSNVPGPNDEIEGTKVSFEEAEGEVASPERGMYSAYEVQTKSDNISAGNVKSKRLSGNTLWLIEFYLTDFMSGNISKTYLKKVQDNFDAIREGGAKAIVRFAYRNNNNNPDQVQEPEVDVVLRHVEQLKPILQANEDVLFALQAGFVGCWGEWYYTTHFVMNPSSTADYQPRKKLTDALLDAVPASRQIQLRTPKFKMKMYGLSVKDTITAKTAHDGSIVSRLAGHNDCFGASDSDEGTFDGNDTREFWKADTRYAIMGGETCKLSDYCLCPATLKDLEDYHWTYLHDGYNEQVLGRWQKDGCMGEIRARLGYRLVLQDVHYGTIEPGKSCKVTIRLNNKGFAAPMNPREAWLVWVGSDGKKQISLLGVDPRTWHSGYNAVVTSFTPTTAKGTLYLELSDPLLPDKPAYSIALANKDVFDSKTGLNKLFEVQ